MKMPRKPFRKRRHETPKQIEVSFAKHEVEHRILLAANAACAARGGIARMTLGDWCEVEAELRQEFVGGFRMHRRCSAFRAARAPRHHGFPAPTRE
jgi:hypothetical protein